MTLISRLTFMAVTVLQLAATAPFIMSAPKWVADLSGVVLDGNGLPVANAEVALPALAKTTLTNDSGEFRFTDMSAGPYELRVRHVGYQEVIKVVNVLERGTPPMKIVLLKVATLNAVEVTADPVMNDFDANRRLGLGKFLTRLDLERQEHRKLSEVLEQVGARTLRIGPHAWVGNSRGFKLGTKCSYLDGHVVRERDLHTPRNPGCGCFVQVYLDDVALYNGEEGQHVPDINFILPQSLEGVEFYKTAGQTPLKYSRLNSQCGVLVLHTRRTPGVTKP